MVGPLELVAAGPQAPAIVVEDCSGEDDAPPARPIPHRRLAPPWIAAAAAGTTHGAACQLDAATVQRPDIEQCRTRMPPLRPL